MAVQTQWASGFGGYTGLDYSRVRDGAAMAGITFTPELFEQLRVIELAVLEVQGKSQRRKPDASSNARR